MSGMRHTRTGWWLEEAVAALGPIAPTRPLEGDTKADVVIVGGGYLGMWTAWQLKELEPNLDVLILEAGLCGHGPSGRNGGFVSTLWDDLPKLRERAGDAGAVEVCRASERALHGIGAWCAQNNVDAWYTVAPRLDVATTPAQVGLWDHDIAECAAVGSLEEIFAVDAAAARAICDSPLFLSGALWQKSASVQPARLALGLRARLLERGVRIHEHTRVTKLSREAVATTDGGTVLARAAVLADALAAAQTRTAPNSGRASSC